MTTLEKRVELLERLAAATLTHQHLSGEPEVMATLSPVNPPMYMAATGGKAVLKPRLRKRIGV